MADVTDRNRAVACALLLMHAELRLGLEGGEPCSLQERCRRILTAARHGGIDARGYRLAYMIARRAAA
jgi:hypothetical protein